MSNVKLGDAWLRVALDLQMKSQDVIRAVMYGDKTHHESG